MLRAVPLRGSIRLHRGVNAVRRVTSDGQGRPSGGRGSWQGGRQSMVGRPDMRPRGIVVALVICVALLAAAPAALANATQDAYCDGCSALHQKQIPFTGLDIALVVAAGGALLAEVDVVGRRGRSEPGP